jgi:two-component system, cell cycle response regulator
MSNAARILIVEDNLANLELMTYLLGASGYQTLNAGDGAAGLEVARREAPDLILCDVQMPIMDGHEMARQAKSCSALREIPLIAVTAFARNSDRDKALAAGFDGYLSKPIDPETFVQQVESFLAPGLRRAPPDQTSATDASYAKPSSNGLTVLVVDNLRANLDLASSLLEYSGYCVVTAQDPKEAMRLARNDPPDLILSDVCMPEGSGYDFIREIKNDRRLAAIPFVFITSTVATEDNRRHGLALGAVKFLFRPMDPQQLLTEISDCLVEQE